MLTGEELGKAIEAARNAKGVTNADLARQFNVKPPSVQGWIKTGRISKDKLQELIGYFSDVVGPAHWGLSNVVPFAAASRSRDGAIDIPRLNVAGSMGYGRAAPEGYVDVVERVTLNKDYLSRTVSYTSTVNLAVITGFGDSMEGTYNDGDLLLVDTGVKEIKLDAVYVVRYHDDIYIKRFQRRPGKPLLMISDNKKYEPVEITPAAPTDFEVLGRVLMAWNAKKL